MTTTHTDWFRHAEYGMMIHWGLYSLLAGEYRGQLTTGYAEWLQADRQIPNAEYGKLATAFDPLYFDAPALVALAQAAGMRYLVVTAKHHDGFALYDSAVDDYNVVAATPFGRDVIGELAAACRAAGLRFGVYYSQDLDWHEPNGGGYTADPSTAAGVTWDNRWDFPDVAAKDYAQCFDAKIVPQVRELMTHYGDIATAWFDVPVTLSTAQSQALYAVVKAAQPDCLINSRLGNGTYDYVELGDNEVPDALVAPAQVDYNALNGAKPSPHGLYESAGTTNHSWGYSAHDQDWLTPAAIAGKRQHLNALGINYLLNVGLDPLGRVPARAQAALLEAAKLM
ncbi:alpha-L-fucosidase [Lacticaseibacillus daqingensis]|uniref:alpha-L-fucosidase n=1 Tax=Lacticaseibacillus daqingensis TaxID=2486014 RepID=UPI000F7A8447|nr:alpha-L-fucosidase [Lacticaseibacillus daqingensis]